MSFIFCLVPKGFSGLLIYRYVNFTSKKNTDEEPRHLSMKRYVTYHWRDRESTFLQNKKHSHNLSSTATRSF